MTWLQELLALISSLSNNALVLKALTCIATQTGWSNILACILAASPSSTPADAAVLKKIEAHVAARDTTVHP